MLKFNGAWRFDSPGTIPGEVVGEFSELIGKVASQGDRKYVLEHFKSYFANAAGTSYFPSSSESWAETDLNRDMTNAGMNAPLFIEAFYDACDALRGKSDYAVPDVGKMNRILSSHNAGYVINPPDLFQIVKPLLVAAPQEVVSLDEQAQEMIQESLKQSEQFLAEGKDRPAVQEILWLLETVSTAFQGLDTDAGSVQGKYFNKIVGDLRRQHKGQTLDQVLEWIQTLHGYLSSPTGGGIRHGTHLKSGIELQPNEARLFCNLIRSYIAYLTTEHERLSRT